jgi:hypothetical protein
MKREKEIIGYLPDEKPAPLKLLLYAIQQVIVMFPATIAVALITGFQVSTTLFASGLANICFTFISGKKIQCITAPAFPIFPLYRVLSPHRALQKSTVFFRQKLFRLHSRYYRFWSCFGCSRLPCQVLRAQCG